MNYDTDHEEEIEYSEEEEETPEEEESALIGLCTDINEESMKEIALGLLTLNGGKILPTTWRCRRTAPHRRRVLYFFQRGVCE